MTLKKTLLLVTAIVLSLSLAGCSMLMGSPAAAGTETAAPAAEEAGGEVAADALFSPGNSMNLFNVFQIALAAYMLYSVVTGKGKLFENKYTKCDYAKYKRIMRITCGVSGALLLISGVLELAQIVDSTTTLGWVLWGVSFASIIAVVVLNVVMTDRKAAALAQKYGEGRTEAPKDPLRAAFVFDDEEQKPVEGTPDPDNKIEK